MKVTLVKYLLGPEKRVFLNREITLDFLPALGMTIVVPSAGGDKGEVEFAVDEMLWEIKEQALKVSQKVERFEDADSFAEYERSLVEQGWVK